MGIKGRLGRVGVGGELKRLGDRHVSGRGSSRVLAAGLERCSSRVSRASASSIRSDRGVVDILVEQIMRGNGVVHIASGCLL